MQKIIVRAVFVSVLVFIGFNSKIVAQPPPPPPPAPCGTPFGGPPCPIDGGVSFLIAAGLAYGGKKTYDLARKKS